MASEGRERAVSALQHGQAGSCTVITLAGRVGIADSGWIHLLLELPAAQERGHLIVDLSRLSSMDWWVALILAWASRVIDGRGGMLVLVHPQPAVARLLDAVGAPVSGDSPGGRFATQPPHLRSTIE